MIWNKFNALTMPFRVIAKMSVHWSVSPQETMYWWCWKTGNDEKSPFNEILFVVAPLGRRSYLFVVFPQSHISILMGRRLTSRRFHLDECQAAVNTHILSQDGTVFSSLWIIGSDYVHLWSFLSGNMCCFSNNTQTSHYRPRPQQTNMDFLTLADFLICFREESVPKSRSIFVEATTLSSSLSLTRRVLWFFFIPSVIHIEDWQ